MSSSSDRAAVSKSPTSRRAKAGRMKGEASSSDRGDVKSPPVRPVGTRNAANNESLTHCAPHGRVCGEPRFAKQSRVSDAASPEEDNVVPSRTRIQAMPSAKSNERKHTRPGHDVQSFGMPGHQQDTIDTTTRRHARHQRDEVVKNTDRSQGHSQRSGTAFQLTEQLTSKPGRRRDSKQEEPSVGNTTHSGRPRKPRIASGDSSPRGHNTSQRNQHTKPTPPVQKEKTMDAPTRSHTEVSSGSAHVSIEYHLPNWDEFPLPRVRKPRDCGVLRDLNAQFAVSQLVNALKHRP